MADHALIIVTPKVSVVHFFGFLRSKLSPATFGERLMIQIYTAHSVSQ